MKTESFFETSCGEQLRFCRWIPAGEPRAVIQIVHGIAEHVDRYDDTAEYLNNLGYLVVAEDHMGHGKSVSEQTPLGCFTGGWFQAVDDTYRLLTLTREEYPDLPYVLLGHSMGSFITRTLLEKYPDSGVSAAVLCGTGWIAPAVLTSGRALGALLCRRYGAQAPSPQMESMAFSGYNRKVEHPRTKSDWLSRDSRAVDRYLADPLCGFTPSAGLMTAMLEGVQFNQKSQNLARMHKGLPVLFISGGDDPVGDYGKGVEKSAAMFRKAGMEQVSVKIYPLCRHELFNEINRLEILQDLTDWLNPIISRMAPLR